MTWLVFMDENRRGVRMLSKEESRVDTPVVLRTGLYPPSKKLIYICMGFLIVYVVVRGIVGAASKALWFDELLTLAAAGQPNLHALWNAASSGFDAQTPPFDLVERAALKITSNKEIALRLPSILAFPCTLICLFTYTKRQAGELIAFLCVLLLLSTGLFRTYLIEARAYSMMAACIAFALVCYQRLPSRFWAVMLGLALVLAESFHYYAIVAMIPFGLAETVFLVRSRRFRWSVWVSLAVGLLPLIFFWSLLSRIKQYYGTHSFSQPVRECYASLFLLNDSALGMALAMVSSAAVVWWLVWPRTRKPEHVEDRCADLAEGALLLGLIVLPFITFVAARLTNGPLLFRYVLATTFGVAVGTGFALAFAGRRATAIFALLLLCVIGMRESRFWRNPANDPFPPGPMATSTQLQQIAEVVESAGHRDLPVVMGDALLFVQLSYYSQPDLTNRMVFLIDERREVIYQGSDNLSKITLLLQGFLPLHVADYSEFTATHPEFLLFSDGLDWNVQASLKEGSLVQLLKKEQAELYLVKKKVSLTQ
jgi:hypothetical protein